jgi:hypothetical protein
MDSFLKFFYLDRIALISECGMWNSDLNKVRTRLKFLNSLLAYKLTNS